MVLRGLTAGADFSSVGILVMEGGLGGVRRAACLGAGAALTGWCDTALFCSRGGAAGRSRSPRPFATAREHAASSVAMCPMRVWLLFFSGLVAAYLAWTSKLFGGGASDAGAGEAGEAAHHASEKVTWRDWAKFAFDGLSGRYLYNAVTSRGADAKAKASSARPATRARTRREKES